MKEMLKKLYPETPVDFINSGLNGSNATKGYERLMQDVIPQKPDLLIVCFGLNDSNAEMDGLETYKTALKKIFHAAKEADIETIFMTPNMMNTYVSAALKDPDFVKVAEESATKQNSGRFDAHIDAFYLLYTKLPAGREGFPPASCAIYSWCFQDQGHKYAARIDMYSFSLLPHAR